MCIHNCVIILNFYLPCIFCVHRVYKSPSSNRGMHADLLHSSFFFPSCMSVTCGPATSWMVYLYYIVLLSQCRVLPNYPLLLVCLFNRSNCDGNDYVKYDDVIVCLHLVFPLFAHLFDFNMFLILSSAVGVHADSDVS